MMANEVNLDFEWDVHKASSNAAKHGVTFEQAATVWQDAFALTVFDAVHSNFEDRWHTLGAIGYYKRGQRVSCVTYVLEHQRHTRPR